jgi:uncharacterized RDD family membrane protein YckC
MTENSNAMSRNIQSANNSTLIEFPGVNRNRPAWRKELSERFREIQQRRSRDATFEVEESDTREAERNPTEFLDAAPSPAPPKPAETTKQLGLVPTPDEPEMNPIVAAALRRIERARAQTAANRAGSVRAHGGAATAAARVVEEQPEQFEEDLPTPAAAKPSESQSTPAPARPRAQRAEKPEAETEHARPSTLVVVPTKLQAKPEPSAVAEIAAPPAAESALAASEATTLTSNANERIEETTRAGAETQPATVTAKTVTTKTAPPVTTDTVEAKPQTRHVSGVIDEFWLERQGVELLPKVAETTYDDRAPRPRRIAAALLDLLAVAFLSAPFAAVIELSIGNWGDPRVSGSMAGIVAVVMFLYQTCSVALAGRTLGMSLCALHAVDARLASVPTTWQCVRRAFVYMLSLAAFGLGILYALFDAEGRTAHDLLSGTVVAKK